MSGQHNEFTVKVNSGPPVVVKGCGLYVSDGIAVIMDCNGQGMHSFAAGEWSQVISKPIGAAPTTAASTH